MNATRKDGPFPSSHSPVQRAESVYVICEMESLVRKFTN
jgi:hypothetical protein